MTVACACGAKADDRKRLGHHIQTTHQVDGLRAVNLAFRMTEGTITPADLAAIGIHQPTRVAQARPGRATQAERLEVLERSDLPDDAALDRAVQAAGVAAATSPKEKAHGPRRPRDVHRDDSGTTDPPDAAPADPGREHRRRAPDRRGGEGEGRGSEPELAAAPDIAKQLGTKPHDPIVQDVLAKTGVAPAPTPKEAPMATRKCGLCRKPGHRRESCPEKGAAGGSKKPHRGGRASKPSRAAVSHNGAGGDVLSDNGVRAAAQSLAGQLKALRARLDEKIRHVEELASIL